MELTNYNRVIDLKFSGKVSPFKIECPVKGPKPNITISGTIIPADQISDFEVHIKNLYCDRMITDYDTVIVSAGYVGNKNTCIIGSIVSAYRDAPGPEGTSVLQCVVANYKDWLTAFCDVSFDVGTSFETILYKLSEKANLDTPRIDGALPAIAAPMQFSGLVKDAVHEIRKYIPDVNIRIDNNRFIAYRQDVLAHIVYEIPVLSSPPQFTGASVSITTPWIPHLRPGDAIKLKPKYFIQDKAAIGISKTGEYKIQNIQFEFSTVDDVNTMIIVATQDIRGKDE